MKILVNGLGPNDTLTYKGVLLRNGAYFEMEDRHAKAYIQANLIKPCENIDEVKALQNLEIKNETTRRRIEKKVVEIGGEIK